MKNCVLALSAVLVLASCGVGTKMIAQAGAGVPREIVPVRLNAETALQIPAGWRASIGEKGRIVVEGLRSEKVVLWAVFLPANAPQPRPFEMVSAGAAQLAPDMQWSQPQVLNESSVRVFGRSQTSAGQVTFAYRNTQKGVVGFVYLTRAAAGQYATAAPAMAAILASAKIVGSPELKAPEMSFVPWREPNMAAFTTKAPAGWDVKGGFTYFTAFQAVELMEGHSPDGQVTIFSGDQIFPRPSTFRLPMPGMPMAAQPNARPFQTAVQFLTDYARVRLPRMGCRQHSVIQKFDLPYQSPMPGTQASMGMITVACDVGNGVRLDGVMLTTNTLMQMDMGGGMALGGWDPDVWGFLAPPPRMQEGLQAVSEWRRSRSYNPEFVQGQMEMVRQSQQIQYQTSQQISGMISDTGRRQAESFDRFDRRREMTTLEQVDVLDPVTGRQYRVDSSSNHYWIDPAGTIVGTNVPVVPDVDFRQMVQLPW